MSNNLIFQIPYHNINSLNNSTISHNNDNSNNNNNKQVVQILNCFNPKIITLINQNYMNSHNTNSKIKIKNLLLEIKLILCIKKNDINYILLNIIN